MPVDPTYSETRRNRVQRRFHQKWRTVRGDVRRELTGDSYYRPQNDAPISRQSSAFREWLERELDEVVVEPALSRRQVLNGSHWTGQIVREFYEHGIRLAHQDLKQAGVSARVIYVQPDAVVRSDYDRRRLGVETYHVDVLEQNYDEIYNDLVDASRETSKQAYREYRDALRTGATLAETIDRVNDRMEKVGSTRTDLVAQTKLIRTINDAIIARYVQIGSGRSGRDAAGDVRIVTEIEQQAESSDDTDTAASASAVTDGGAQTAQSPDVAGSTPHGTRPLREQHQTTEPEPEPEPESEPEPKPEEDTSGTAGVFQTAEDDRVCEECSSELREVWSAQEIRDGIAPQIPVHPNCRCRWVLYSVVDLGWEVE